MLTTIKLILNSTEQLNVKCVNNFFFFVLDRGWHCYSNLKSVKRLTHFFAYTFLMYYIRIVWRGKAYRIRFFKKASKFTLNFGHSHWYKLWYNISYVHFFRLKRQNYLAYCSSCEEKKLIEDTFNSIRQYNKYTRRGIRTKKSPFIRRFGKISQVNSILHSF